MTTIAVSDGFIAWDSQTGWGDSRIFAIEEKVRVFRVRDPVSKDIIQLAIGAAGMCRSFDDISKWIDNGAPYGEMPKVGDGDCTIIAVSEDGVIRVYGSDGSQDTVMPPFAIGSGAQYARGAMAFGATAYEAVNVAKQIDVWTGGGVKYLDFRKGFVVTYPLVYDPKLPPALSPTIVHPQTG